VQYYTQHEERAGKKERMGCDEIAIGAHQMASEMNRKLHTQK
jgi:hypothetical protein